MLLKRQTVVAKSQNRFSRPTHAKLISISSSTVLIWYIWEMQRTLITEFYIAFDKFSSSPGGDYVTWEIVRLGELITS